MQALAINRQSGDRRTEGATLCRLGDLYREQGRIEEARHVLARSLVLLREVRDRRNEGLTLKALATLERQTGGDPAQAERWLEEGEGVLRSIGTLFELAVTLCERGKLAVARQRSGRGALEEAERLAVTLDARSGSALRTAIAQLRRAQEAAEAGRHERLFQGQLVEDLPEGLRRWLVRTGHLPPA